MDRNMLRMRIGKVMWVAFIMVCYLATTIQMKAQAPKLVMGRVLDKEESEKKKKPVPFDVAGVGGIKIFYFNTVQEAKDLEAELTKGTISIELNASYEVPDPTGSYQITLPETGALVIKVGIAPPVVEPINRRREITTYVDMGHVLGTVTVTASRTEVTSMPETPDQYGDIIILNGAKVSVPAKIGKSNGRMIVQPYVINNSQAKKIVMYRLPHIYDGVQYNLTQDRRMGYEINKNDSLGMFIEKNEALTEEKNSYMWNDTIKLPNPNDNFQVLAWMQMEDYTRPYYERTLELSTRSPRRPLRFLEYNLKQYELDPKAYEEKPKVERRTGVEDISLTFLVGKAELDPSDPGNNIRLEKLKAKLREIVNGESSTLKELHLKSISSPEGSYASNVALSKKRLEYARSLVYGGLPASTMKRLYTYTPNDSRVAEWTEVADLMENPSLRLGADSLMVSDSVKIDTVSYKAQADEIRSIVEQFKSPDAQFQQIVKLPYYTSIIKKFLPKLRSMTCEYTAELYRALTPEEILKRYRNDEDYRTGKKEFALYEYWNLFNMVKDPMELEALYRRAYDYSIELTGGKGKGKPWVLAANNLAVSYLRRDTVDTDLLKPLVDYAVKGCDVVRTFDGAVVGVDNVKEVVANQLAMYLKKGIFSEASRLARILPDEEKEIKAFAFALGGYYKVTSGLSDDEIARRQQTFELVRTSSPLNNVVMCLAMKSHAWNEKAEKALEDLPADDAKTLYLKTILLCRKGDFAAMEAENTLTECFKKDNSFIAIAEWDGDISEDCFKYAKQNYEDSLETSNDLIN